MMVVCFETFGGGEGLSSVSNGASSDLGLLSNCDPQFGQTVTNRLPQLRILDSSA